MFYQILTNLCLDPSPFLLRIFSTKSNQFSSVLELLLKDFLSCLARPGDRQSQFESLISIPVKSCTRIVNTLPGLLDAYSSRIDPLCRSVPVSFSLQQFFLL